MANPFSDSPNGFFIRDMIVFNALESGGFVSKGFLFEPPDLANAEADDRNAFHEALGIFLASLAENQRLQIQWYCDSDYRNELFRYREETLKSDNPWTRRSRNERFMRYWQKMERRELRRQRLVFYVSRSMSGIHKSSQSGKFYLQLLEQLQGEFQQVEEALRTIFSPHGARIQAMSDEEHYLHYKQFLNPSITERSEYDPIDTFDPAFSIQENCWHSEGVGQSDFGFFMDGYYQSIVVLTRWPRMTFPGIINRLTDLNLLDYAITVNVDPLPVRDEIRKEEREHDRIAGDYASEKKVSLLTVLEKKERKISALAQGHTLPFNAEFLVRVWDKSKDGLTAKVTAIKNAINGMNSAQYFESNLPVATKRLFFQSWPGWTWGKYEHRKLYAEHSYLADMLPVSATFTGHLATAEAIYDGNANNLVGVKTFAGSEGNETPQHAVLLGMSGSGKSVNMCDLLTQTELYYDYTVLIEEGLSYGIYTQTVDPEARPIILQPDGNLTINYLDTGGLPLTPLHLSSATALVSRMIGIPKDEEKQLLRQAQIARYLKQLYADSLQDWLLKHPDEMMDIARHAYALRAHRLEHLAPGATTLDAFVDFRDWSKKNADEARAIIASFEDADILRFLNDPQTAQESRNLAFAYFAPEEFPTHRMLQELMELEASGSERDAIQQIATLLLPWCRDGHYGCLFDGQSNVSLTGKVAHFELGYIPESAKELKAAAGFLVTNYTRQHIMTLPRGMRKRNVYEEVARFLDFPEGAKIVKESYAQMRKFNCWNIAVVQQYGQFKESEIRSAVFGNARQFFLMRQSDRHDVEDIARDVALPDITQEAILNYPLPDQQAPGKEFSAFTYFHTDSGRPICGTAHNVASPEMLYCSSTSGEHFDKRARQLKGHDNVVEGIIAESEPTSLSA